MDEEVNEKQQLRFACLEIACRQSKTLTNDQDQHYSCDLSGDEAVTMAEMFYKFVTKQELN